MGRLKWIGIAAGALLVTGLIGCGEDGPEESGVEDSNVAATEEGHQEKSLDDMTQEERDNKAHEVLKDEAINPPNTVIYDSGSGG